MAYRARVSTEGGGQPHLSANGKGGRNGETREGRETAECMRAFGPHASKEKRISVERREPRADGLSGVGDMRRLAKKKSDIVGMRSIDAYGKKGGEM